MTGLSERDGVIVLPERLDISTAGLVRDIVVTRTGDLVFDAASVTLVTTPGLQVLMAVRDYQIGNGASVRFENVTTGFKASIRILGVTLERLQTQEEPA